MAARDSRSGGEGGDPSSDADLARRFDRLSRELKVEQAERAAAEAPPRSDTKGYGLAFRLASEFVAGVIVGAILGWALDRVAGTSPWGLIGLLLLGFVAGVLNVIRSANRMSAAAGGGGGSGEPR